MNPTLTDENPGLISMATPTSNTPTPPNMEQVTAAASIRPVNMEMRDYKPIEDSDRWRNM